MEDFLPQEALERIHRLFGVECNNRAWDLVTAGVKSPAEQRTLLNLAHSAAYHWGEVGTPINQMRAEILLAHVHAMLGEGSRALEYAQHCLEFCENEPCEDWDKAFAHAEMAHAAAAAGNSTLHTEHYAQAQRLGEAIADSEDRKTFFDEFARVPQPSSEN